MVKVMVQVQAHSHSAYSSHTDSYWQLQDGSPATCSNTLENIPPITSKSQLWGILCIKTRLFPNQQERPTVMAFVEYCVNTQ